MRHYPLSEKSRNLVRFAGHLGHEALHEEFMASYGFRDCASRFSFFKNLTTAPGPDDTFVLFHINHDTTFQKLLGLEWEYPGQPENQRQFQQPYNSMNYYRSHIEEWFSHTGAKPLPPFEGRCLMYMQDVDQLVVRYELRNTSATHLPLRLRWWTQPSQPEAIECSPNTCRVLHCFARPRSTYKVDTTIRSLDTSLAFTVADFHIVSDWLDLTLDPDSVTTFAFEVIVAMGVGEPRQRQPLGRRSLDEAIAETEAAYARLPHLPGPFATYEPLALKATGILRSLRYRDQAPDGRELTTIHANKTGCAASWWWDGAFSLLGLADAGDLVTGQGMVELLLGGVDAEGCPPCTCQGGEYTYSYQHPIMAWGISHLLGPEPDLAFLGRVYEPLSRYVNHWLTRFDVRGQGLVIYPPGSTCLDDSQRWQEGSPLAFEPGENWYEHRWGGMQPHQYEHPDTNAYLYLECRALAHFADVLGKADESRAWTAKADAIATAVNAILWDEQSGYYGDRHIETGVFTGLASPASFMPLYAGIAPADRAERMLRQILLNPDRFYTILPFPTADRSHPSFRSGGFLFAPPDYPGALVQQAYWKGRTWPHVSYWLVGALWQYGLEAEADAAALRILDALSRSESIHECYDSLTGTPIGHAEFMWSSAAVLALVTRRYARGPLGVLP